MRMFRGTLTGDFPSEDSVFRGYLEQNAVEVFEVCQAALDACRVAALRQEPELMDRRGLESRVVFAPVGVATGGRRISPPLFESLGILGRAEPLARLLMLLGASA